MEQGSQLRLTDGSHVVHFYETEQSLVRLVGAYLAASLLDGEQVLVIAAADHHDAFDAAWSSAGVDVQGAVEGGRLVLLDADEILDGFMADGLPSASRFDATVGSWVRRLGQGGGPVRAYGEMVARLWQQRDVMGAVQLERLWNDLAERTPFGLLCAYPLELMTDAGASEAFDVVCDLHSHVVEGAPDPGAESTRRFVASPHGARLARRYVSATLEEWGYEEISDDAIIAAGELVANAIQHGGRHFTVGLSRAPHALRVIMSDSSRAAPRRRDPVLLEPGGRGLRMVDTVTTEWGYDLHAGGKVVWIQLDTQANRAEEAA